VLKASALGRGLDGLGAVVVGDGADVWTVDVGGGVGTGGGAVGVGLGGGAGLESLLVWTRLYTYMASWRKGCRHNMDLPRQHSAADHASPCLRTMPLCRVMSSWLVR